MDSIGECSSSRWVEADQHVAQLLQPNRKSRNVPCRIEKLEAKRSVAKNEPATGEFDDMRTPRLDVEQAYLTRDLGSGLLNVRCNLERIGNSYASSYR